MPHQCAHWLAMTGLGSAAGDRKGRPYGVTRGLCVRVVGDADPYGGGDYKNVIPRSEATWKSVFPYDRGAA